MGRKFGELRESNKSLKHEYFRKVSYMCLAGTVVAQWSLTQEVAGLSPFNDKYLLLMKISSENI